MTHSRAQMPQNFYDITSDMLLVAPEPQYLYGMMFLAALRASLVTPDQLGLPGRAVGGVGADYTPAEKDRLLLSSPIVQDVFAAKVDFNAAPGNSVRFNRPVYANTTYTETSRRIPLGTSISTTPVKVTAGQASLTLFRYGGPYDTAQAAVAPVAIEAFDANMGVHKAAKIYGNQLKRDCHKFLDAVQVTLLDLAATSVYPEGFSASALPTENGQGRITYRQISDTEAQMDTANVPTFADGFRMLTLHPKQSDHLRQDKQFRDALQFQPEIGIVSPNYLGSINKFHVFKSNTLTTTTNSNTTLYNAHAIAPGALLGGMGRPLRVAANTNDNYGETAKVIWLGDLAFGLADNSLVYKLVSGG